MFLFFTGGFPSQVLGRREQEVWGPSQPFCPSAAICVEGLLVVTRCQELMAKTNMYVTDTCRCRRREAFLLCWGLWVSVAAASEAGILSQFTVRSRRTQWLQIPGGKGVGRLRGEQVCPGIFSGSWLPDLSQRPTNKAKYNLIFREKSALRSLSTPLEEVLHEEPDF